VRRELAAGLIALAWGVAAPAAQAAPGDAVITDLGPWMGQSGRVLRVAEGQSRASLLAAGRPFQNPWAAAVAGDGSMLVADQAAEAVFSVSPAGAVRTVAGGAALGDPVGITLAPHGLAYLSDRSRDAVLRLDLATGAVAPVARVEDPAGLAMDKAGKLLVTDGRALRRVDPGTGAVTTAATGAPLDEPIDVAIAQDGTIYLAGDRQVARISPTGAKSVLAAGAPFDEPRAIDIAPDGDLLVVDRDAAGGSLIHVDRASGVKTLVTSGGPIERPTGLAVVGGAGVDASGGGNGDPDGPAAPPPPAPPGDPGGSVTPGAPGGPAAGAAGAGTTVTLPDGTVITLPPGVTPGTSGIRGVDFAAPAFLRNPRLSAQRFRAARRGRAFISVSVGTRLFWALNEAARITISVQKYRPLSRICRRGRQSRHRTGTRCRKYISLKGRFATASTAGVGSVRFRGRLEGRRLKPGRYRFVIRARDGAGNLSKPRRPVFRIVR
jgi:hypothetical protein